MKQVLLAEDDPVFRATLEEFLCNLGYRVITAGNGRDALKIYERERDAIDLIVTDICMPEPEDGINLIRSVRQSDARLPIVVATGYDEYQAVNASDKLNTMVFDKPFNFGQFQLYLNQINDQRLSG
jgi:CheY-like chemotaxis protein